MYIFGYLLTYCHLKTIAKIISAVGNPLTIALFFGVYITVFNNEPPQNNIPPIFYVLLMVLILVGYILYNIWKKRYKNFDVSDQTKRMEVYKLLIFLLLILNLVFYFTGIPLKGRLVSIFFFIKVVLSYLINQKVKVSLHTSMNFLFALVFYPINPFICDALFLFGFFNAWSRLVLGRHSVLVVIFGFVLGSSVGFVYLYVFNFYI